MTPYLMVCADDYAQNDAISEGIRQALNAQRLNAVSCLVTSPAWPTAGEALKSMSGTGMVGLHFNLTLGHALSREWTTRFGGVLPRLDRLIVACYVGKMDRLAVQAEWSAQLEAFRRVMGRDPDFIDGHQHVHQLPVIRQQLVLMHQQQKLTAWVRSTVSRVRTRGFLKSQVISGLGGRALVRELSEASIPTNTSFSGVYSFHHALNYPHYFRQFLAASQDGGLIMCHPGLSSKDRDDPLHASRPHELAYLMSDAFLHDLEKYSFALRR
jgi:predicted glycoside hydrolase/deacetylase ChbG (UPF0249 family)